ncbi:aldehyde ferredoxin oxidoreductase family protein [Hippea maritima]|uniref:Aldehyde ferredoxin oxidoreductase n=1 Tax=Hippea maritima (strain ATCC 700847 / DSM 10411 / MH2) TaxID=760142 RepID=F2LVH5_HIPMA|nr:aldehyde ferredoxin oxidoreductase family protein [Hippea maritima]AEA33759.1 Aldehyde ferredoxin oxidoreductase [Hippea maritima DSM 10411]
MANDLLNVKVLRINLSTGEIKREKIDLELVRLYLGGRGLASKILYDEIDPAIDPLSPENKLIFANGLLTGTSVPTGGRYMVVTKGPLTGTIASSNSGGFFGAELRKAGWSMVIVEGKAEKPVYISIKDDDVQIKDANHLWGKTTDITTDELIEEFGDKRARVACIGPAGENLVKFAAIMNDKSRAAGRTGVGAVMGSKNLKAIVVRGSENINVMDKAAFMEAVKSKVDIIRKNPITGEGLPKLGTKVLDSIINQSGLYPTKNFQFGTFEYTEEVNGEALVNKGYLVDNKACYACPIGCGRDVVLPNGRKGEGPEYESGWAFGADCGVEDLIAVSDANFMCNELGLDTISAGGTIAAAMEMYERGYLPKEDLGNGPELRFGSSESLLYYLKKIAYREGIGDKLAEGSYRFCQAYGHSELSMSVKKQEMPAYDPRGAQGHGLEYATSNRGGCHVRGYMISPEVLGVPEKLDPQSLEGKAGWVKIFQDLTAVIDSAGLCLFSSFALSADDYTELINAGTGFNFTTDDVLKIGERIWNLERKFNLEAGISPEEDKLPNRFKEPLPDGAQKGSFSHVEELLPKYYEARGWNSDGTIPEEKLKELKIA